MRSLEEIRVDIDKIDKEIINLLKQRSYLIHEVAEYKKNISIKINFAREARMLNAFKLKDVGSYSNLVIMAMWRELIMGTLMMEGEFISAISFNDAKSIAMLRDHFGKFTEIKKYNNEEEVINSISNNQSTIGVLKLENNNWSKIPSGVSINLILPFIGSTNAYDNTESLYVISKAALEYIDGISEHLYLSSNEVNGTRVVHRNGSNYLIASSKEIEGLQKVGLVHFLAK